MLLHYYFWGYRAIALNSNFTEAYYNRGTIYRKSGEQKKAFNDLNKAIEINYQFADAYIQRGIIYYQQKNTTLCKQDWEKAADLFLQQGNTKM